MTILNKPFDTQYNTAPFSKLKTEEFLSAFKTAIKKAKSEIDTIVNNKEKPTFRDILILKIMFAAKRYLLKGLNDNKFIIYSYD